MNIDDIRAFQMVASLRSFSEAARVMGVRKSVVSRSVQRLEAALHVRLLERSSRDVALTDAGNAILSQLGQIVQSVDGALDMASDLSTHPRGRLRISAGIGFGIEVLAQVLPTFSEAYPEIAISLDLSSRCVDLVAEQIDLAIRMGPLADSALISTRLGAIGCQLCAAPDYLDKYGRPLNLEDLAKHNLLSMPRADGLPRRWTLMNGDGVEQDVATNQRLSANDPHALGQMVINGAGITSFADFVAIEEIAKRRLERVLPDWDIPAVDVSIVMPPGRDRNPAARAFVSFMRQNTASSWWLEP